MAFSINFGDVTLGNPFAEARLFLVRDVEAGTHAQLTTAAIL